MSRTIQVTISKSLDPDFLLGRSTSHLDEDTLRKLATEMVQSEPDLVLDSADWQIEVEQAVYSGADSTVGGVSQ